MGCGSSKIVTDSSDKQTPTKSGQSHSLRKEPAVTKSKNEGAETELSGTEQKASLHKTGDGGTHTKHTKGDGEKHTEHTIDVGATHTEHTADDRRLHAEHIIDDGETYTEHTKDDKGIHTEHMKDYGGTDTEHTQDGRGTHTEHTKDDRDTHSQRTEEDSETPREQNETELEKTEQEDSLQEEVSDTDSLQQEKREIEESISKIIDSAKEIYEEIKDSEEKDILEEDSEISMDDIGGLEDIKKELYEQIMLPLVEPELFSKYGTQCSYILLHGPPGCGKKMLAKAFANENQINFILHKVKPGKYVPYTDELREAFDQARNSVPCVLFLDLNEIDTTVRHGNPGTDYIINQLLTELDGLGAGEKNKHLFVIGSVPSEQGLDPSLLRPGRLSHMIHVPLPDEKTRVTILKVTFQHTAEVQYTDLEYIAANTKGFTGADLAEICNKAVRLAGGNTENQDGDSLNSLTLPKISMNNLNEALQTTNKSLTDEQVYYYEGLSKEKDNFRFGFPSPPKGEEKQGGYKVGQFNEDDEDDQLYGDSKTTSITRQQELHDDGDEDLYS